jgi:hypothetical protein
VSLSYLLAGLEELAARLGVAVRAEPFGRTVEGRGGLCWVRGRPVVVMDERLAVPDRVGVLAAALGQLDLTGVQVAPSLLARIDAARRRRGSGAASRRKRRPGLARARPR